MKRVFLTLLLLCFALPAEAAAPTFVAKLGEALGANGGALETSLTSNVTVSAGSDRMMVVSLSTQGSGITHTGCAFNGTETLTSRVLSDSGTYRTEIFTLASPTVTTADVVCNFSAGTAASRMTVYQYNGASGVGVTNTNGATSASLSVSLTTTAVDSLDFASFFARATAASPFTPAADVTERTDNKTGAGGSDRSFTDLEQSAPTVGAYTLATTAGASDIWRGAAIEILAVPGAATGINLMTLLGVGGPGGGTSPPPNPDCTIEMAAGSTDAQIIAQLAAAPDGAKLCIAAGETVLVSNPLQLDISNRALTLDCQGSTLQRNTSNSVVIVQGAELGTSAFTVSGNTITWTTTPTGLAAGDWVKLSADDALPGGAGASTSLRPRMGQAVQVASTSGTTTVFNGTLLFPSSYTTNRRANKIQSKNATLRRCRLLGSTGQTSWQLPSIQISNAVTPLVELTKCENGVAGCLNLTNTVGAVARDIDCRNLPSGSLASNYCIHSDAGWSPQVAGVYAENTRKPFEASANDLAANTASLADYGAAWAPQITDSVCYLNNGSDGCFGYRSEAQFGLIERVYGFSSPKCVRASGLDNTMRDSFCAIISGVGIDLNDDVGGAGGSALGDDGIRWLFDHVIVRQTTNVGLTYSNNPTQNRICSSRIETSNATVNGLATYSQNLESCTYVSGMATIFNSVLAANVTNTQENYTYCNTCDDIIPAGAGDDTIDALGGNDLVWGGTGADTITLGSGEDRLAYFWTDEGNDTVTDFTAGGPGDIIDIAWFLARAAGANYTGDPAADGYYSTLQSGGDCLVKLDSDGTAGPTAAVTVATLTGVTCANLVGQNFRTTLRGN